MVKLSLSHFYVWIKITFQFYINASFYCMVKVKICKKVWNRCYIKMIWRNHLVLVYAVQCMGYFWQLKNNIFYVWKKGNAEGELFLRGQEWLYIRTASIMYCKTRIKNEIKTQLQIQFYVVCRVRYWEFNSKYFSSYMIT